MRKEVEAARDQEIVEMIHKTHCAFWKRSVLRFYPNQRWICCAKTASELRETAPILRKSR